ncbi:Hypothetical protein MROS_0561 [Melioribacter roseus P3M-2]|uniref:Secretion system C-terminal sorting domain-containing protein n=1 Tax=Melioribacter roseus (strain DSM 23840 / JCM 17771 / VKM B-2668 / P3M-2) TaxID=1191523 RepID=I6ZP43_MELRP|nr:T9SS type A sorting domain-containing protein [Melioribacter roseus]AFN73804.1 Hypothetical protein MROS_0561 [Melioribacter roseus P3M-2]
MKEKMSWAIFLLLISNMVYGQGIFTVSTDKPEYSYGEKIVVKMTFQNNTDSSFNFWADPYCITELSYIGVRLDLNCSLADGEFSFPPGKSQTWRWVIDPSVHGVPTEDGDQKIVGSFLHLLSDTASFKAPKFYGGRLRVVLRNNVSYEDIAGLMDSINATLINVDGYINDNWNQTWQIQGYSIDSLAGILINDRRIINAEPLRIIKLDTTYITGVETDKLPDSYLLYQNYPNPFNPSTTIEYYLPENSFVELKIYDILGRELKTLVNDYQNAGRHKYALSIDDLNRSASSVYFCRLKARNYFKTIKLTLLK